MSDCHIRRINVVGDYGRCSLYFDPFGLLPCVLANIKVRIDHRRRGIGRGLLRSAVKLASAMGYKSIYLMVKGGSWIKSFYESEGFVYYACDSYDKNKEWMVKDLSDENIVARDDPPKTNVVAASGAAQDGEGK